MARYIDADLLHIKMEDLYEHHIEMRNFSADGAVADCLDMLDNTPTADVEEVKHSRWENISGFDVCNICGTSPAYWEPKPNNPKGYPPYCHNCGAKMDGGKEDV